MKNTASLVLILLAVFLSCTSSPSQGDSIDGSPIVETRLEPSWIQEGLVYELFVRDFTPEGSFSAIIPRLDEIKALGVETIWLMPIHPIGEVKRKGPLGSPYSIRDYYTVDPSYGSEEDFRQLVQEIHDRDMHIILDLVVNHTAWDHPWIDENPQWYSRDVNGDIVPPVPDWSDVADLDFSNSDLRRELTKVMKYWVSEFDIDGYRVDTASMVPRDFWEESIPQVQAIKPVFFLGETGDTSLSQAGFQVIYAWSAYHGLKDLWRGARPSRFAPNVESEIRRNGYMTYLRFTTNHDETAWDAAPPVLFGGQRGAMAAAVAHLFMAGLPLVYNGQELGNEDSWAFFDRWSYDWDQNPQVREFYRDLGQLWRNSDALRWGDMKAVALEGNPPIIAYLRRAQGEELLVVVNVSEDTQTFSVPDPLKGQFTELFTNRSMSTVGSIEIEPYDYRVYRLR